MTKSSAHSIASIDPGISGAIALFDYRGRLTDLRDMPTIKTIKGKKKRVTIYPTAIADMFLLYQVDHVFLELSQARPPKRDGKTITPGIVSTGSYMRNYGILLGICAGMQIQCTEITPAKWKRHVMTGMGKDKGASIIRAGELYPEVRLPRVRDHGKADALLIGWYALTEILRVFENANSNVFQLKAK